MTRKKNPDEKQFALRLPLSLYNEIKTVAEENKLSMNSVIVDRLSIGSTDASPENALRSVRAYATTSYSTGNLGIEAFNSVKDLSLSRYDSVIQTLSGSTEDHNEQEGLTS